ncbi:Spo0E family sporulation regulatory protein-aspartic acid phosphatase [Metallumcola ferriviriculae]|uniref:Spo0E family sporulation regulatory protein-aspartic acid phosphatase n=1 Tax=Metallumcola ferriviriculae TaxID=3039180 RepID=A0AAU0UTT1_9FIRM|nr:Spo0E family sporulation regulatory protein-aspartic acid phosphatase [Desulfitibacteraceae bacterium MK1]
MSEEQRVKQMIYSLISKGMELSSKEVVHLSQKLDKLILERTKTINGLR